MNPIIERLTGPAALTDEIIVTDLLMAAKTGVRTYARALTETATPAVRETLHRHLDDAIAAHGQIFQYMLDMEWYDAYVVSKQVELDIQNAQTALGLQ
ncbi:spore coat protein [Alicyclobacillus sp. ALC3]|uniref:spore coat protein n=1 Tax=Alicyclobacillus sp. ALC3 TaxID=2796143 RepID=UPI0023791B87|nr:spore coat protein [Alicyclobacillus sp. ALC3]WDL95386.1 spore coat protein [Alicyclobacillus sp. ALC3]